MGLTVAAMNARNAQFEANRAAKFSVSPAIQVPLMMLWKQVQPLTYEEAKRVQNAAQSAAMMEIEAIARNLCESAR